MVGKPVPQKPNSPSAASTSSSPTRTEPRSSEEKLAAVSNRNSPSPSAASALTSSGGPIATQSTRRMRSAYGKAGARLVSLDAFRGFIMMMLAANGFGLLAFSRIGEESPVWQIHDRTLWQNIGFHFDHPDWVSSFDYFKVSFWDLIQPSFMFMVGAAMPFSYLRRTNQGQSRSAQILHALIRSVILILLGVFLQSIGKERTTWVFPNVLCQIGFGYFFASLLLNRGPVVQCSALAVILIGYWGWFFFSPPPVDYNYEAVNASKEKGEVLEGRFTSWSKNANAAFFFDQWLLPKLRSAPDIAEPSESDSDQATGAKPASEEPGWLRQWLFSNTEPYTPNAGGYTTLNFIPSIATTLLGILCGQLLITPAFSKWTKLGVLIAAAAVCLGLGIAADLTICPVVKRIWTPSWVVFSGGYVIGILALFFLLFDIAPLKFLAFPLVVVGVNSLLTYMLGQTVSVWMRENVVKVHLAGIIDNVFGPKALDPQWYGSITIPTVVFLLYWLFLLWLYRQRIFLRI